MVLKRRSFPFKCCWLLAIFIALRQGTLSQEFCEKNAEEGNCKQHFLYSKDDVKVLTVAIDENYGLEWFLRSAEIYGIDVEVLGKGTKWTGGDMKLPGGGQKINLLKDKLTEMMNSGNKEKIILFTDSYNVLFLSTLENIVKKFQSFPDTRVLFAAEQFCWPDNKLASQYPNTEVVVNPYLNSGSFIGYLPEIYEIVNYKPVSDKDDDQLFYTKIYLNKKLRESLKITLDCNSTIFLNLNGALPDICLETNSTTEFWPYLENVVTKERPLIVHGNRSSKMILNHLGNHLNKASASEGCFLCADKRIKLEDDKLPTVMMAVFIEQATPFLEDFLDQVLATDYPKEKIHLLLRNNVEYHETEVDDFFQEHSKKYATAKRIIPSDFITESEARNIAKYRCMNSACDYLFSIDSVSRVEPNTLRHLLSSGYDVIAPMLVRDGTSSNFCGDTPKYYVDGNTAGFYATSADYMDILSQNVKGVWNVPYIMNCYLVKMTVLRRPAAKSVTYFKEDIDAHLAFSASLRDVGVYIHVSNELDFGHLVNPDTFDISLTNPDMYQIFENGMEWSDRYLHEEYDFNFNEDIKHLMPCPDVYCFPLMSERFCTEWIEIMEAFGQWSNGSNNGKRLASGNNAVPTYGIDITQVGLHRHWLHVLKEYVLPLQKAVFIGYHKDPIVSNKNLVLRYWPNEQASLHPHEESSTYTINLALNTPNVDFEGGGCRFIRFNCSVLATKPGWMLMHPGHLTHNHEGLLVTNGTRYIMVSFVDPFQFFTLNNPH